MKEKDFPGVVLRERREAMGFSIEGARARTHVPPECLRAFESGVFTRMPEQAYAVGFLRTYCRFLDLEPEPFVDQYLVCTRPEKPSGPFNFMKRREHDDNGEMARPYPVWVNNLIVWGAVCAVILLIWLTYTAVVRPLAEDVKGRVEAGAVEVEPPVHFEEDF
ncbi:MAG TPA: helix-turn-helix domain-containing protein [Candidatus Hydrogenedentes bacterium]|nr:helix-turn-helix domain-containing protein [Candidatus Hydrogenedentota bacterium]